MRIGKMRKTKAGKDAFYILALLLMATKNMYTAGMVHVYILSI
jgi:hypothetical protein